jgi:hypothetical protein
MIWRRLLILDLMLVAALAAGIIRIRKSWLEFDASHQPSRVQAENEPAQPLPPAVAAAPQLEDWTDISAKNPFSFDRNDVSIIAPKEAIQAKPKPALFGIMSLGGDKIAMLGPGQGSRASRPVKVGETLEGWEVVEINDKSVIVASADGFRQTIIMNDPSAQIPRSYERTLAANGQGPAPQVIQPPQTTAPTPPPTAAAPAAPQPSAVAPGAGQKCGEAMTTPFGVVIRCQ